MLMGIAGIALGSYLFKSYIQPGINNGGADGMINGTAEMVKDLFEAGIENKPKTPPPPGPRPVVNVPAAAKKTPGGRPVMRTLKDSDLK